MYLEYGGRWVIGDHDDISKRQKLSYAAKVVEIIPVVQAGELSHGFSQKRMCSREVFFRFLSKMEGGRCRRPLLTYHKLPYEIKIINISQMFGAGELVL
ncbi:hypothetical protein AVEN_229089-1 [Araneus ventricosus]|uniref:Uncharacterized protein n=1 Tax=Araneus ventricosus TaxID=182803 RepID=A0A4Y2IX06_ARAVE|nr:hypothetical protein AVEN_229089-1 [Araneus ventricosus]